MLLIDRQAVLDELEKVDCMKYSAYLDFKEFVEALPVQEQIVLPTLRSKILLKLSDTIEIIDAWTEAKITEVRNRVER